jgi:hypothetical protein
MLNEIFFNTDILIVYLMGVSVGLGWGATFWLRHELKRGKNGIKR